MGTYIQPQVTVSQVFKQLPNNVVANQNALVFGPNYQLFRYAQSTEKALIGLGAYNPSVVTTYGYPSQPAGSTVDLNYVKLVMDNVLAQYASIVSGATAPLVVVSNTELNKLRAMPAIESVELQTVPDTGVTALTGGYFNGGPNLPDALYFWPTGGAKGGIFSVLPTDAAVLDYRAGVSGNTGVVDVPANALTSGVKVEGPFGMIFDFNTATRKGGSVAFTGKPSDTNTITIGGTTFTFKNTPAGAHDVKIGSTAQACYQNLRYAVESAGLASVSAVVIIPGGTTAAGTMYVTGTSALTMTLGTLSNATLTAVGVFNSFRQPVTLTFADDAATGYFTLAVSKTLLPSAIDFGVDAGTPVKVEYSYTSAGITVAWNPTTAKLSIGFQQGVSTLGDIRAALLADSDVAALFTVSELSGATTAQADKVFDETGVFYFADSVAITMVPDGLRVKVLPNEVTFATGNGFSTSAAYFKSRGVRVGDRLGYSVLGTDAVVHTGMTKVAGYEADVLAPVIGAPATGASNAATQAGTDLSLTTSLLITAGSDNQRNFAGYVQALDADVQFFPGSYSAGVLADDYTVTITQSGLAGAALATVTSASGLQTWTDVPIVAAVGPAIGQIYLGQNMYMVFTQNGAGDAIFQLGDTFSFAKNVQAPFVAVTSDKVVVSGEYAGPSNTTYRLEVTRGGVFERVVNVIPGLDLAATAALTIVVDWTAWLPGDADDEYILTCTKAGTITTAQFKLVSQRGDNVASLKFSGSGDAYTRTLGAQGLYCYMTATGSFVVGDSFVVLVNGCRPQVRVTDSAGIDQSKVVTVADGSVFDVGLYGVVAEFASDLDTLAGLAPDGGLTLGDVFYIPATAAAEGPIKTLVLADDLPAEVVTGLTVTNSGSTPVVVPNYAPTAFSTTYLLLQASTEITSEQIQNPPNYNWQAALTGVTLNSGIQVQDGSWVNTDGSLPWMNVNSGTMYLQYRALLSAYTDAIYSLTDINDVVTELGTISPDNPLAQGVYNALLNSGSQPVYFMATPSDDLAGYAAVLNQAAKTSNVYALAPLNRSSAVQDAIVAHVMSLSTETAKHWRVCGLGLSMTPAVAVVSAATYTTPGTDWTATITQNPLAIGTAYTLVTFTNGTPNLLATVKVGDTVKAAFATDAWGNQTNQTYTVASVKSNTQLLLVSGPAAPVAVAAKTEVWHTYSTGEQATIVAAAAGHYDNRRVISIFPWVAYSAGVAQTSEFIAAAVAGLISSTPPQQGLTTIELNGFDDIPLTYSTFSTDQLNTMAAGGAFIVMQDSVGGAVYIRHQITSASPDGNLLTAELSITRDLDAISYYFANTLAPYVGRYNITDELLTVISTQIQNGLNYLGSAQVAAGLLGPMVILGSNTKINSVVQHPTLLDHILASVDLELPIPANVIQLQLVV